MKSPGKWNMPETLGPDDVYELFLNTIKILPPKVSCFVYSLVDHLASYNVGY